MKAEVRFNSFHGTILPVIMGQVTSVSRDRFVDEQSKQPYFLARTVVNEKDLPSPDQGPRYCRHVGGGYRSDRRADRYWIISPGRLGSPEYNVPREVSPITDPKRRG